MVAGVDVHGLAPQEADQGHPGLGGQVGGEGARRGDRREQRHPGHPRLLGQLEAGPSGDQQHVPGQRQPPLAGPPSRPPCPPRCAGPRPRAARPARRSAVNRPAACSPPVRSKPRWAARSLSGSAASTAGRHGHRVVGDPEHRAGAHRVDARLAAHPAGTGGVEVAGRVGRRLGHAGGQHHVDHVVRVRRLRPGAELRGLHVVGRPDQRPRSAGSRSPGRGRPRGSAWSPRAAPTDGPAGPTRISSGSSAARLSGRRTGARPSTARSRSGARRVGQSPVPSAHPAPTGRRRRPAPVRTGRDAAACRLGRRQPLSGVSAASHPADGAEMPLAGLPWPGGRLRGGGAGRRRGAPAWAGSDKPGLPVGGRPMRDRVLAAVAGRRAADRGRPGHHPVPGDVRLTREEPAGGGPVAAVAAGLALLLPGTTTVAPARRRPAAAHRRRGRDLLRRRGLAADATGRRGLLRRRRRSTAVALRRLAGRRRCGPPWTGSPPSGAGRSPARRCGRCWPGCRGRGGWSGAGPPPWFDCDTDDDVRRAEEWTR